MSHQRQSFSETFADINFFFIHLWFIYNSNFTKNLFMGEERHGPIHSPRSLQAFPIISKRPKSWQDVLPWSASAFSGDCCGGGERLQWQASQPPVPLGLPLLDSCRPPSLPSSCRQPQTPPPTSSQSSSPQPPNPLSSGGRRACWRSSRRRRVSFAPDEGRAWTFLPSSVSEQCEEERMRRKMVKKDGRRLEKREMKM